MQSSSYDPAVLTQLFDYAVEFECSLMEASDDRVNLGAYAECKCTYLYEMARDFLATQLTLYAHFDESGGVLLDRMYAYVNDDRIPMPLRRQMFDCVSMIGSVYLDARIDYEEDLERDALFDDDGRRTPPPSPTCAAAAARSRLSPSCTPVVPVNLKS